jgi:hypothetical protein
MIFRGKGGDVVSESRTIIDEAAWRCASILVANLKPVFMPAEVRDAHELIYETVRAAMEAALLRTKENARLKPCNNN